MATLTEPSREIPVIYEADVCVIGGSCTGLFAAIRAARLGARVVIVEKENCFGGSATTAMVNVWHTLWDTEGKQQIIGGLTQEVSERLIARGVGEYSEKTNPSVGFSFNSEELKIELDAMAREAKLKVYFHTSFCAPYVAAGRLEAVVVENKSGRGAIKARVFIDATGDGDLAARLGCETYLPSFIQPSTTCARFSGWDSLGAYSTRYAEAFREYGEQFGFPAGFAWGCRVPGSADYMLAGTRIYGKVPTNADDLTEAELEGRRQVCAIQKILKHAAPESHLSLQALPSRLGLRESRHIRCGYHITEEDVLSGRRFPDAIANGSYRVDIHHQDKPGITLRYLNGSEEYCCPGFPNEQRRWRPESVDNPTFYQIPFRAMLPGHFSNLIVAGRMIDADPAAFAAVRVMVNTNQMGEAAGVAAFLSAESEIAVTELNMALLRSVLAEGGSIVI